MKKLVKSAGIIAFLAVIGIKMIILMVFMSCSRQKENVPLVPVLEQNNILENTGTDNLSVPGIEESIEYKLSSYLIEFMTTRYLSSVAHRHQIAELFIEVFNDRQNLSRYLHDEEVLKRYNRLKEDTHALLNEALSDAQWYSDGQDVRSGAMKIMVCYMTLAILSPHDLSLQNNYIDSAKSIALRNTLYDYPVRYTAVVFLEILLKEDEQKNIEALKKLYGYLYDIIENQNYDEGYSIKEDMEFINSIVRHKTGEAVSGTALLKESYDFSKILLGDFSELAGTWVNRHGDGIQLRADGTFSEGQEAMNFVHLKDTLGISEFYRWFATIDRNDPSVPYYGILLLPAGVDYIIENYTTDKSKVRLLRGVHDVSVDTIYYRENNDF